MSAPTPGTTQLRVARLTKAHGLKGAIKLELYTDEPDRRFMPGSSFTLQVPRTSEWHGKKLELVELRWYNSHPVAFFRGIDDRTTAETLLKAILWIDEEIKTEATEDDAWYDYQLVGLRVVRAGTEVGTVRRIDHFPAQDLLIVATPSGEVMVPFVAAIVPSVDLERGIVTVTPPMGLFEEIAEVEPAPLSDEAAAALLGDAEDGTDGAAATVADADATPAASDGAAASDDDAAASHETTAPDARSGS